MTVESAPALLPLQSAPRRRLSLPAAFATMRVPAVLLACAAAVCTLGACSARDSDARVALTTSAARELAQAQPGQSQRPQFANAFTLASDAAAANLHDSAFSSANDAAKDGAALPANAVRSPARSPADASAQAVQIEPLVTPVIHTVD